MKVKSAKLIEKRGWMLEDVQHKRITGLANKEDGSIISFVKFPNGNIRAKSKTSFISDQAVMAQKLYEENPNIKELVGTYLDLGYVPIFEYVGFDNQIVLEYHTNELILLQVRDSLTGDYKNVKEVGEAYGVKYAESFSESMMNLDDLMARKEIDQSPIEGWIITFSDGQMAKIKTLKYMELHGLIGPDAFRENLLIQSIIGGNIDDVISALIPGEKKDRMIRLEELVSYKFNHLVVEWKELRRKYFQDLQEVRKDFAVKHSKDPLFSSVIKNINGSFSDVETIAEKSVKEYILKRTSALGKAKDWIETLHITN